MPLRALSTVFVGMLLTACATPRGAEGGLPTWYAPQSAGYPSARYIVGRGACGLEVESTTRAACAADRARQDAILQIRADVRALVERSCRLETESSVGDKRDLSARGEAQCTTNLASRSAAHFLLLGATPREQACGESKCFALIALSRDELVEQTLQTKAGERAEFEALMARARTVDLLSSLGLLAKARALAGPLDADESLLLAVSPGRLARSFRAEVVRARSEKLGGVKTCLHSDPQGEPDPARVFAFATQLLSEQGLEGTLEDAACTASPLRIDYSASSARVPVPARANTEQALWTISYAGKVRVSSPDGAVREREVVGRGVARLVESARREAQDRLAEAVRDAVAELLLGDPA